MIDAMGALRLGLVEKVVRPGQGMAAAMEGAAKIMEKGPLAVAVAKKVINRGRDLSIQHGLELESEFWANLTATEI